MRFKEVNFSTLVLKFRCFLKSV